MHDDVTLFLVTSKRDLVVKISQEFKRNNYGTYRTFLLEIALMQDDTTKFPLNAKARLGGDQNQVVTVVMLIFHFVEFPTDMFNMYYIPLEFP